MPSLEKLRAHHATHRYREHGNERQATLPPPDLSKVHEFLPQEIIMNQGVTAEIERSSDLEIGELYLIRMNEKSTRFALFHGISESHTAIFDFGGILEEISDKAVFKVPLNFAERIKPRLIKESFDAHQRQVDYLFSPKGIREMAKIVSQDPGLAVKDLKQLVVGTPYLIISPKRSMRYALYHGSYSSAIEQGMPVFDYGGTLMIHHEDEHIFRLPEDNEMDIKTRLESESKRTTDLLTSAPVNTPVKPESRIHQIIAAAGTIFRRKS